MYLQSPFQTVFYSIEVAIKEYRRMSQRNIGGVHSQITIDQVLVLRVILEEKSISQVEIGELLFRDHASITRMVNLMVENGYIQRKEDKNDRRKHQLLVTAKGKRTVDKLTPIVKSNRSTALKGISEKELMQMSQTLHKIIENCTAAE